MNWMRSNAEIGLEKYSKYTAPSARKRIKYFKSTTALLLCVNCRHYVWCFLFRQSLSTASLKRCIHYAYRYIEKKQKKKWNWRKSRAKARFRWKKCRLRWTMSKLNHKLFHPTQANKCCCPGMDFFFMVLRYQPKYIISYMLIVFLMCLVLGYFIPNI